MERDVLWRGLFWRACADNADGKRLWGPVCVQGNTSLQGQPCDHSLSLTKEWLLEQSFTSPRGHLQALRNRGGFCDCEVLNNVV